MHVFTYSLNLSREQGTHGLRQFPVRNSILAKNCPIAPSCNSDAKYRTIDGSCNNLENPLRGKSETAFQRILPPLYDDGEMFEAPAEGQEWDSLPENITPALWWWWDVYGTLWGARVRQPWRGSYPLSMMIVGIFGTRWEAIVWQPSRGPYLPTPSMIMVWCGHPLRGNSEQPSRGSYPPAQWWWWDVYDTQWGARVRQPWRGSYPRSMMMVGILWHPLRGNSETVFQRILPPLYDDGEMYIFIYIIFIINHTWLILWKLYNTECIHAFT